LLAALFLLYRRTTQAYVADDAADREGDERDGPEEDALDRPDAGAGAGNVQKLDEAVLPALPGDVVYTVLLV